MEINKVFGEFKKWLWLFVLLAAIGFIAAFCYNLSWKPSFETSEVLLINPKFGQQNLPGQPISLTDVQIFTDNLIAAIQSEEFGQGSSLKDYQLQKLGPSVLRVSTFDFGENGAKEKNQVLISKLNNQIKLFNDQTGFDYQVLVIGTETKLQTPKFSQKVNLIVGGLAGFVFAVLVFSLVLYFKNEFHVSPASSIKKRS